jgi:serpin B
MGLQDAFAEGSADFSGMLSPGLANSQVKSELFLSNITHKTGIKVDEECTMASAFSGEIGNEVDAPLDSTVESFNANRPFIYVIHDKPTDTILFFGSKAD